MATFYEGDLQHSEPTNDGLFAGQKLWFSRAVPLRNWLIQNAEQNGAQVVLLEQQADVKLVDHAKKSQAPGTHSYRYVELSIKNQKLEDLEDHRVGSASRAQRPVGSSITASKGGRNKFTDVEDQILWNFVKPYVDNGGAWKGNEIYKQLEIIYPNHTYQSWRDRWIKHTQYQTRQITGHPHSSQDRTSEQANEIPRSPKRRKISEPKATEPQRANTSDIPIKQGLPSESVPHVHTMGNVESSQSQAHNRTTPIGTIDQTPENDVEAAQITPGPKVIRQPLPKYDQPPATVRESKVSNAESPDVVPVAESSVSANGSRLPLAFNFSQDEARMLYRATCHILDARSDTLDDSWSGVANEYGHTKEAWRKFFYDLIVPEYMKRHNIQSEAELEVHCKAQVKEVRERAAAAAREHEALLSQDKEQSQTSPRVVGENNNEPSLHARLAEVGGSSVVADDFINNSEYDSIHVDRLRGPLLSTLGFTHDQTPQPNESTKLSPGRGPPTKSSQVNSILTSQSLQQSPQLGRVAEEPKTLDGKEGSEQAPMQYTKLGESYHIGLQKLSQPFGFQGEKQRSLAEPSERPPISSISNPFAEYKDISSHREPQVSDHSKSALIESASELQDIPYQDLTPQQPKIHPESPLFVPAESEQSQVELVSQSTVNQQLEPWSSPPAVRLVDDGKDDKFDSTQISEYAASETPSEIVQFEGRVQLSQAWETAPERDLSKRIDLSDEEQVREDHESISRLEVNYPSLVSNTETLNHKPQSNIARSNSAVTAPSHQDAEFSTKTALVDQTSTEDDFETAPQTRYASRDRHVSELSSKSRKGSEPRVETQELFQQPTQFSFNELAAIPEPLGGWDEEEPQLDTNEPHRNTAEAMPPPHNADWTTPLPPPDEIDNAPASPPKDSAAADVDTWLTTQPKTYDFVPTLLLKPLSHRALELTSMDLGVADTVLARMIQQFEKGELPAVLSLNDIRRLPKRERRHAVAKIVDELVPSNLQGCWTRADDRALLGVDGREVKRVEDKHGADAVKNRFEFLKMWHSS